MFLHFIQSELYFCAPDFYPEVVLYRGYADGIAEESGVENGVMADWFLKGRGLEALEVLEQGRIGGFGGMGCFAGEGVCLFVCLIYPCWEDVSGG